MIFIPFIWFSLLLIFIINKKKCIEISGLITIAYIITSFFAIIIDLNDLYRDSGMIQVSLDLIPTFLYCFLITITILPFIRLPILRRDNMIPIKNIKLFNNIIYFYFGVYILFLFFFGSELIYRVNNPDIAALRVFIVDEGDDLGFSNYSGIIRIIARLVFILGSSAMYLLVMYFYSIAFLNRSFKFNLGILLLSTIPIMIGMITIDRSKTVYWIMSYVAIAVLFRAFLSSPQKKQIKSTFVLFFVFFTLYLAFITVARYGEQDQGAINSLIVYAGQPFNNFCLFYERLNLPGISFEMVLPILSHILDSSDELNRSILYNRFLDTNIFASFSGILIREIGLGGSILYSLIFYVLVSFLFKNIKRYNITSLFLVIILLYIPYLGIFGLFYASIDRELAVWLLLITSYFLNKKSNNRI